MRILHIPNRKYPVNHSYLNEVHSKLLPIIGCNVDFILGSPDLPKKSSEWNNSRVFIVKSTHGIFSRIRFFFRLFTKAKCLFENNSYDLIQVRNGILESLVAIFLCFRYNTRLSIQLSNAQYMRNINNDGNSLLSFGHYCKKIFLSTFLYKFILVKADLVQSISENHKNFITGKGIDSNKIKVTTLGFPFISNKKNSTSPSKQNRLIYVGSLDYYRRLEFMIYSFYLAKKINPLMSLTILGKGNAKSSLISTVKALKLKNSVNFLGPVKLKDVSNYIKNSDIGLSPIPPYKNYILSYPTKTVEYLAHGIPVVCTEIPSQARIVRHSRSGIVTKFNVVDFSKAILAICDMKSYELRQMGNRGFEYVFLNNNYENIAKDVFNQYREVISET